MRKSLEGLTPGGVRKDNYPNLPEDLVEFNYWLSDSGHCIMAIPKSPLPKAEENGDLDMFEVAAPVKYVLEKGCIIYRNHVLIDVRYDQFTGADFPDEYYEF